ncbi:MAG: response regulator [Chloroflexi bacterium]|nr:response regulator [Chloroflexota bacterium]
MTNGSLHDAFLHELRQALHYLYVTAQLRKSPLLDVFGLSDRHNPVAALQQILTENIRALKPDLHIPPHSDAWRIYHVLTYCYLEQSSQVSVASNLGLSVRQLRRLMRIAEQALADQLWQRYDIASHADAITAVTSSGAGESVSQPSIASGLEQELEWLRESVPSTVTEVTSILSAALKTAWPLLQSAGVQTEQRVPEDLPSVSGQLPAMRQALVNLLLAAARTVPGGRLRVSARADPKSVHLYVQACGSIDPAHATQVDITEYVNMARQFASLFGSTIDELPAQLGQVFAAAITLPIADQLPVLVIDDNADTLRLLQRYLSGTHYRFVGVRDPDQALAVAETLAPPLIVLDVMMPGVDDWELLGRLREHPRTRFARIIVCTILPHEQLALTLGAAGFLRKPISREVLLGALDRQAASLAPKSL